MPRKQRFKPSRKPKSTPQTEEAAPGRTSNGVQVHNDNVDARSPSPARDDGSTDDDSPTEAEQQSR
jgi:hypothetical protein